MLRAISVRRRADPAACVDVVVLDHAARHLRRRALESVGGLALLADLPTPTALDDGDALELEDGRLVAIAAAPEALIEARAADGAGLARLAWHVGNRHVACEIGAEALWIAADHVLAEMLRGLGAAVAEVTRPFRPERGAYGQSGPAPAHGHDHHHHHHD